MNTTTTTTNLLTCHYCRAGKPRFAKDLLGSDYEEQLMFSQYIPYHPTSPLLESLFKWRQVWICNDCVEQMK
jgi:hypothetical protein